MGYRAAPAGLRLFMPKHAKHPVTLTWLRDLPMEDQDWLLANPRLPLSDQLADRLKELQQAVEQPIVSDEKWSGEPTYWKLDWHVITGLEAIRNQLRGARWDQLSDDDRNYYLEHRDDPS